jgi:two-component system response regulator QseB
MSVTPSCPILVVHEDDLFRRKLIAALDERHFTVTFVGDGEEAVEALQEKKYRVILLGVDLAARRGLQAFDYVRGHRQELNGTTLLVVGEASPELRTLASFADETLLKPVDAAYVADRARNYC